MTDEEIYMTDNEAMLNPRYIAYALAHGNNSWRQMHLDKTEYPFGAHMTNFIIWISKREAEFKKPEVFDQWLMAYAKKSAGHHGTPTDQGDSSLKRSRPPLLAYTKNPPIIEGYYWMRESTDISGIVRVREFFNGLEKTGEFQYLSAIGWINTLEKNADWCGPVLEPK